MSTITLNTWVQFDVTDLLIFNESADLKQFEYHITIPAALSNFFDQHRYRQTTDTNNAYEVDHITLGDGGEIRNELSSLVTGSLNPAGAGIRPGFGLTVGERIVEILALKLFGNARAKAAIANDTEITQTSWKSPLEHVFNTDRNLIFEQYVGLDRVEPESNNVYPEYNDTDNWQTFNFSDLTFVVPVHLSLLAMDDDDRSGTLLPQAKTGPKYGETTQLVDGVLTNCPLKLTLTIA
jgi:lipoprotein signal peptidase